MNFFLYKIVPARWQDNLGVGICWLVAGSITTWGGWRWLIIDAEKLWLIAIAIGIFIIFVAILFIVHAFCLRRWQK